ncbi:MAG: NADH-quinone oxidoreductase subunit C [Victivallales bacterium]|nr:NADH-quinone oxidoreductase subunit C [Victivallales bacterium]
MNWLEFSNHSTVSLAELPVLSVSQLRHSIMMRCREQGWRPMAFFGCRRDDGVRLFAILADDDHAALHAAAADFFAGEYEYESLTPQLPGFGSFERELFEQTGIKPAGHPWLKPLRFPRDAASGKKKTDYRFWTLAGESVHEVAVGPVHAGVIEPGHFRFMCTGEEVRHLEIQLGYQHRGIEKMLRQGDIRTKAVLVEKIAGDSCIANGMAFAGVLETAAGVKVSPRVQAIRTLALELERIALHLSTLSGLATDIAYLPGSTFFGATRTYVINSLLALCGSRFGFGLIRPGRVNYDLMPELVAEWRRTLTMVLDRTVTMGESMFNQPSVLSRLEQTGVLNAADAAAIGMLGVTGRASGVRRDVRADHPFSYFKISPIVKITLAGGDVFARGFLRYLEARRSLQYVLTLLDALPEGGLATAVPAPAPNSLTVAAVEGPRGEICHTMLTGPYGECRWYKLQDPSLINWYGLALAVRTEGISDFPICNKSFDLSYCGHDL